MNAGKLHSFANQTRSERKNTSGPTEISISFLRIIFFLSLLNSLPLHNIHFATFYFSSSKFLQSVDSREWICILIEKKKQTDRERDSGCEAGMHIERNWILKWGCCYSRCCCHVYGRMRVKIHMKMSMNLNKLTINWLLIKIDLRIRLHFHIFYACISFGQQWHFTSPVGRGGRNVDKKACERKQAGWYAGNQAKNTPIQTQRRTHFISVDRVNVSTTIKITYILFETRKSQLKMRSARDQERELKYRIVLCILFRSSVSFNESTETVYIKSTINVDWATLSLCAVAVAVLWVALVIFVIVVIVSTLYYVDCWESINTHRYTFFMCVHDDMLECHST